MHTLSIKEINKTAAWIFKQHRLQNLLKDIVPPLDIFIDHIEYVINLIGIDFVGIGSDYDGLDCLPYGWSDCMDHIKISEHLDKRGYSTQDIEKVMGNNFLRVLPISFIKHKEEVILTLNYINKNNKELYITKGDMRFSPYAPGLMSRNGVRPRFGSQIGMSDYVNARDRDRHTNIRPGESIEVPYKFKYREEPVNPITFLVTLKYLDGNKHRPLAVRIPNLTISETNAN